MKKKVLLLIILPILLIIIAAGTVAALYFMTDIFKSDQELFLTYFAQNTQIFQVLKNENVEMQKQFKGQNTYQSTGNLDISIQEDENTQNMKLATATRHDATLGRTYSEIALKQEENDLLKISYINSGDIHAIKADDIIANYIGIQNSDLKTFLSNIGVQGEASSIYDIPDSISFSALDNLYDVTEEQKQHIIDQYLKPIQDKIPENQYSKLEKSQIIVDSKYYTANAYQLTTDTNTIKTIITDCLTALKSDNVTLVLLSNKLSEIGLSKEVTDTANMTKIIDNVIQAIQEDTSDNETINIIVYESDGKTLRTMIQQGENTITIDNINANNTQKVDILLETSEITFQKIASEMNIANEIVLTPDINKPEEQIIINTTIGKVQNNAIENTSEVTVMTTSSTDNIETISSSYTQNIQVTNQIEEIPELNNTNVVIINHYTMDQLSPVLASLGIRTMQVVPNKVTQLGVNVQEDTLLEAIVASGINIGNVNGIGIEKILSTAAIEGGLYTLLNATTPVSSATPNEESVEIHNMRFLAYEGERSGSNVKTLCDTVKNYNLSNVSNPEKQILVQMSSAVNIVAEPTEEVTMESIDTIQEQLHNEKKYIIDFGYSTATGKIVAIGITEVK